MTKQNDAPKPKLERQKPAAQRRMALDSADLPTLLAYLEQTCWRLYLFGDLRKAE